MNTKKLLILAVAVLVAALAACDGVATIAPRGDRSPRVLDSAPADSTCRSGYILVNGIVQCADTQQGTYVAPLIASSDSGSSVGGK